MKKFENPVITVVMLTMDDIICTSGCMSPCPEFGTSSVLEPTY